MSDAEDDRDLMLRYQRGDAGAFDQLYRRHKGPLYRYCLRQCHDPDTAAELFQEVWTRIVKGRASYKPLARFTTWLYQVAHSAWVDHVRRHARRPKLVTGQSQDAPQAEAVTAASAGPPARAQAGQAMQQVIAAIEALPPDQREVFLLKQETDLTIEEIGEATGVSRETAKSRLRYALKKLRAELKDVLDDMLGDAGPDGLAGVTAGLAGEPT